MQNKRSITLVAVFLVAAVSIFLFARPHTEDMRSASFDDQKPAPDFSLQDINGNIVKLSDFKGKTVVLNFWATWCAPCRKEIPDFIEMQNQYGKDGLQFVGVAIDQEGVQVIKPFAEKAKMNYPVLVGDDAVFAKFGGGNAIPVTFLIDKKGAIRNSYVGMRPKASLEEMVLALMREK
ncbi:MAG TPA: TlpA disulfide reductase family protein [Candidatus Kapabacteria bacterium]|nr:TlpA disulfide reductase family protein [Candidatus Kapabacteria bacterium]